MILFITVVVIIELLLIITASRTANPFVGIFCFLFPLTIMILISHGLLEFLKIV